VMCGQQLFNLGSEHESMLFGLAAIFISIAIIPVSLTRSSAPAVVKHVKLNMAKVWRHSHVALIGAVVAGFVTGAFWALAPIYAKDNGFDSIQLGAFLSATVLGGACFQVPLGKLSDRFDRRSVLMFTALGGSLVSLLFVTLPYVVTTFGGWPAAISAFFWGGTCMTLYAICLAHANDNATSEDFVEISSAMLITLGLSSAIGAPMACDGIIWRQGFICLYQFMFGDFLRDSIIKTPQPYCPLNTCNKRKFSCRHRYGKPNSI
jgi:MFS family permease